MRSRSLADWVSCTSDDRLRGSHGRPCSSRESSQQDDDSCIATPRIKESGHHTLGLLARERTRCNTSPETPGTESSGVIKAKVGPHPSGANLKTGFQIPFLRSLLLWTCERASSARMINAPSSSPSGKRILS